jgi:hypothetical protein
VLMVIAVLLIAAPYVYGPVYRFPEPVPFSGDHLWNPYEDFSGRWQRANFHAHGRAWFGLTNGRQSDNEVVDRYRGLGYDVAGVSDYQRIAAHAGVETIPAYEHGYNLTKQHQVAIGARSVVWLDFLVWQSLSHQQHVINRVKEEADLVALVHPATREAYTPDDLQHLTGYDLIEVVNGPFAEPEVWDAALSSGHAVWALANDDTHDLRDPKRLAVGWNMVGAPSASTRDIVAALGAGRSYAVLRKGAIDSANITVVDRVVTDRNSLSVGVTGLPSTFQFIGQNGALRKTVSDAMTATYDLTPADTYIRTVIETPQTVLFLNPILRWDGHRLPAPTATVDIAATWTWRTSIGLGCTILAVAFAKRRRVVPRQSLHPMLTDAKGNTA